MGNRTGACAAAAGALIALWLAAPSSADVSLCPPGSGAGQCQNPQGVAADSETGRVYVADAGNNRVDVFKDSGEFVLAFGWGVDTGASELQSCTTASGCQKGIVGAGAGQLSSPPRLAVDNVVGSAHRHEVYVFETANSRIQRFSPAGAALGEVKANGACQLISDADPNLAVGPAGIVEVAVSIAKGGGVFESRIEKFEAGGSCAGLVALSPAPTHRAKAIAVDGGGSVYVPYTAEGGFRKYNAVGSEQYARDLGTETNALALDSADDLYAAQRQIRDKALGVFNLITEYSPAGAGIRRFGYGKLASAPAGIAAHSSAAGDILASQNEDVKYFGFPPPGPIVAPGSAEVSPIGNAKATLKAEINPEGKAADYRFDYVDEQSFEDEGGFAGPNTKSTPVTPVGAEDFSLHTVEAIAGCLDPLIEAAEGKCLTPETAYRFRVIAKDSEGHEEEVEGEPFTTKPSLELLATYAKEVGTDSATLGAQANPLGIPAGGYFEYVDDASFKASGFAEAIQAPAVGEGEEEIDFGGGEAPATGVASIFPLAPGTTYHYRATLDNPLIEPIAGPERSFTTFSPTPPPQACAANEAFRGGPSALLPDCRAYELVSPLEKNNGDIVSLSIGNGSPAVLEQSADSGSRLAYGSARAFGDSVAAPYTSQYIAAREPGVAWATHSISPPRSRFLFSNIGVLDTELRALSPDLCEAWLTTLTEPTLAPAAVTGFPNIYRRQDEECGGASYEAVTTVTPAHRKPVEYGTLAMELQGHSADGAAAIYVAPDNLTADAPELAPNIAENAPQLYLRTGGQTSFLCVLPGGEASEAPCTAGFREAGESRKSTLENAISADGKRVFWTAAGNVPGKVYVRENPAEKQSKVVAGKCTQAAKACTVAVSAKGEELSGASASRYWGAAEDGGKAIFTTTPSSPADPGDLYEFDVDTETTTLIAHKAKGVMGMSEDAEWVYLVSEEALGGANAEGRSPTPDSPNLYLAYGGATSFIATLAPFDFTALARVDFKRNRVSPDGRHAAWMSVAGPSGYDNADAESGKADAEVYLYDAEAQELHCASCNPTGGRPAGREVPGTGGWIAAQIPAWQNNLYAARALSADGRRLFFESYDALLPRDTNGVKDVYQWEAPGPGGCEEADPAFSEPNGGCLSLISSGHSGEGSRFVDASPSGDDIFIATLSGLLPQDYGLIDIYDARVGGGLPSPPPEEPECEGDVCQSPASPPNDPTPASASFRGAGAPKPKAPRPRCPKGKRRAGAKGGKVRCVRRHAKSDRRRSR